MAQDYCEGDFNYDGDCDADDVSTFLEDFGRSPFNNPCPEYPPVATFFDDFNDGDMDGWLSSAACSGCTEGNYRVEDGHLIQDLGGDGYMLLVNNLELSSHYAEVESYIHDNGVGGITVWRKNADNWVYIMYPYSIGFAVVEKWCETPTCGVQENVTHTFYSFDHTARAWKTLSVDANSHTGELSVYLEDEYAFIHTVEPNLSRSGYSGVNSSNAGASFDDFKIVVK
jgi:hypothetical protein